MSSPAARLRDAIVRGGVAATPWALAAVVYTLVSALLFRAVTVAPRSWIIGTLTPGLPTDLNGTLWFYGWMRRSLATGLPPECPDTTCFPAGECLGAHYMNRVDAILAQPFILGLGMPLGFNVFVVLIPASAAVAALVFFRQLGASWAVGGAAAFVYGFNGYTFYELNAGRPVTALSPWFPLVLAGLVRATGGENRQIGWALGAGLVGAVIFMAYPPWVAWIAIPSALVLLGGLFRPGGWWRAPVVGILFAATGLALSWDFAQEVQARSHVSSMTSGFDDNVIRNSLPVGYPLGLGGVIGDTFLLWSPPLLVALPVLWFDRRRSALWLAGAAITYVLTLGPYLAWDTVPDPVLAAPNGYALSLPMKLLSDLTPGIQIFLRPYRGAPVVLLLVLAAVVSATFTLAKEHPRPVGAVALLLGLGAALHADRIWTSRSFSSPWPASPFFEQLAADADGGAIIELPMGLGHGTGWSQMVHGRPRADPAIDARERVPNCVRTPFVRGFYQYLLLDGEAPDPALLRGAWDDGFRWVVMYPKAWSYYARGDAFEARKLSRNPTATRNWFEEHVGPPDYIDGSVIAWRIPDPAPAAP